MNATALISGVPFGQNQDAARLFPNSVPAVGANVTFLLQLGNFTEGIQPVYFQPPFGPPVLITPYLVGTTPFAIVDNITVTDYNNNFQEVGSVQHFVTITGTDTSLPDGTRVLVLNSQSVSFGSLGYLLLFPLGGEYSPYSSGPFSIDAALMELPTTGSPAPSPTVTPEPSSFILLGTGAAMAILLTRKKQRAIPASGSGFAL